jgi:hypothetical protein
MDGTILGQGSFVAGASIVPVTVAIPSNADWMKVYNYTQYGTDAAGATGTGVEFIWQRGMAAGTGIVKYKINTTAVTLLQGDTLVSGGFTLYDPSGQSSGAQANVGAPIAFSAITNATRPEVTVVSTAGLAVGMVIRLSPKLTTGAAGTSVITDIAGIDMVIGTIVDATHFTLLTAASALATTPGITSGTGSFRIVQYPYWYPRRRYITNITQAINAQVSTSTAHGLTPGQEVRFNIPAVAGMVQLDQTLSGGYSYPLIAATIVSVVDDYDFTINVDTTGFSPFTFPTVLQQPSSFPEVIPVGEDTAFALTSNANQVPSIGGVQIFNTNTGILADSTVNTGYLGMILGTGGFGHGTTMAATAITGPAGTATGDVIYWEIGKSSFGGL